MFIRLRGKVKKDSAQEARSTSPVGPMELNMFSIEIAGQLFSVVTSKLTRG